MSPRGASTETSDAPVFGRQLDIFDYLDPGAPAGVGAPALDGQVLSQAARDLDSGHPAIPAMGSPSAPLILAEPDPVRSLNAAELVERLSPALGDANLTVVLGRSRSTPIQFERRYVDGATQVRLRLHRCFASAPEPVLDDLRAWLRSGKRARAATARLDAWMEARMSAEGPAPIPPSGRHPRGQVHDLAALTAQLWLEPYARSFLAELQRWPTIGWGRRSNAKGRRRLQLAAYENARHWIRVNPLLDAPWVPGWFVKTILFHELLHSVQPEERDRAGRLLTHGPWFRQAERGYPLHLASKAWEQAQLTRLLRN